MVTNAEDRQPNASLPHGVSKKHEYRVSLPVPETRVSLEVFPLNIPQHRDHVSREVGQPREERRENGRELENFGGGVRKREYHIY